MSLVEHARRELERIGEEPGTVDWYCRVIAEFASFGHSGGSAMVTIPVLNALLQFKPLSPLTDDPAEWRDISQYQGGKPGWQSIRHSQAFSADGGRTYWLLDELGAAGSMDTTPLHTSEPSGART
jgi:hypothetical protein